MKNIQEILPLYFVAGTQDCRHLGENPAENLLFVLKQALEGGITCFQFRDKGKFSLENSPMEQRSLAISCQDLCRQYNVPFIVDDNVDLALEIEADGIHVGQSDMPVKTIRARTNKPLIIGWSVNRLDEAKSERNYLKSIISVLVQFFRLSQKRILNQHLEWRSFKH